MRIPSSHDRRERNDDSAMTPLIDVVFLLLIFFVCASVGQIRESLLATELAAGSVQSAETIERERPVDELWLHLRSENRRTIIELNEREYDDFASLQQTLTGLAGLAPENPVILDIQPDVPLGDLIRVYDACRAARFQSISFATDPQRAAGLLKQPRPR